MCSAAASKKSLTSSLRLSQSFSKYSEMSSLRLSQSFSKYSEMSSLTSNSAGSGAGVLQCWDMKAMKVEVCYLVIG